MFKDNAARREFLKFGGAGIAGATLGSFLTAAQAAPRSAVPIEYDVKAFGATGDGKTLDTGAIDKAIAAASGAGGGNVIFGPGQYLCYSIHLKSNVALYLAPGAAIVAAESP